jgi:chlorite dismutase
MAEAPETLEGWYALHDFRRLHWARWSALSATEREEIAEEAAQFLRAAEQVRDAPEGGSALYSIIGHKSDLLLLHLRPTIEQLGAMERAFTRTRLAEFTSQTYSYLSVTELSLYEASARGGTEDREQLMQAPFVQKRLKPAIPEAETICFYPMNKRRGEVQNWFALDLEERRKMMREHGLTGRKYHGRVTQIITGSMGLDDWDWGVTLFADDPLDIKKLIYEMRFDEVSAKYAEFGPFQVGARVPVERLAALLL